MRKKLALFSLLLLCMFIFTGCGIEGGTSALSIKFTEDVFYVDLNVKTYLPYKVYPSTATNFSVSYDYEIDVRQEEYKTFPYDGSILIKDDRFESMTVFVQLGELSDSCEIRLKNYPSSIGVYKKGEKEPVKVSSDTIEAGLVYSLDLMGDYGGVTRPLDDNYIYKITSSNESVVSVLDEQKLLVKSTGRKGSSTITVEILNSNNEPIVVGLDKLQTSIDLVCEQNVDSSFVIFNGKTRVEEQAVIDIEPSVSSYLIEAYFFDKDGFLLKDVNFEVFISNESLFSLEEVGGKKYIKLKSVPIETSETTITIQTDHVNSGQTPQKITFKLRVQI